MTNRPNGRRAPAPKANAPPAHSDSTCFHALVQFQTNNGFASQPAGAFDPNFRFVVRSVFTSLTTLLPAARRRLADRNFIADLDRLAAWMGAVGGSWEMVIRLATVKQGWQTELLGISSAIPGISTNVPPPPKPRIAPLSLVWIGSVERLPLLKPSGRCLSTRWIEVARRVPVARFVHPFISMARMVSPET
jgi:hypothetical protein